MLKPNFKEADGLGISKVNQKRAITTSHPRFSDVPSSLHTYNIPQRLQKINKCLVKKQVVHLNSLS